MMVFTACMSQTKQQKQAPKSRPIFRGTVEEIVAAYRNFIQKLRSLNEQDKKMMEDTFTKRGERGEDND